MEVIKTASKKHSFEIKYISAKPRTSTKEQSRYSGNPLTCKHLQDIKLANIDYIHNWD